MFFSLFLLRYTGSVDFILKTSYTFKITGLLACLGLCTVVLNISLLLIFDNDHLKCILYYALKYISAIMSNDMYFAGFSHVIYHMLLNVQL